MVCLLDVDCLVEINYYSPKGLLCMRGMRDVYVASVAMLSGVNAVMSHYELEPSIRNANNGEKE